MVKTKDLTGDDSDFSIRPLAQNPVFTQSLQIPHCQANLLSARCESLSRNDEPTGG